MQYRCSGESGGYVYLHGDAARRRGGDGVHGDTQRTAAHTPPTRTPRLTGRGGEDSDGDDDTDDDGDSGGSDDGSRDDTDNDTDVADDIDSDIVTLWECCCCN